MFSQTSTNLGWNVKYPQTVLFVDIYMSYPFWTSNPSLGQYTAGFSFTANPLVLTFGESNQPPLSCSVSLLNGQLPENLSFQQIGSTVLIQGLLATIAQDQDYEFTFRISNGNQIADQTFQLQVLGTPTVPVFEWITDNVNTLGYVYPGSENVFLIQAKVDPVEIIYYDFLNQNFSKGITINNVTGQITANLDWQSSTAYSSVTPDYVYNDKILYRCTISGVSAPSNGPVGTGVNIVDTIYPGWQPNSYYTPNSIVYNDLGKIYKCQGYGFSAPSGGPTGTGNAIVDNDVTWDFEYQSPVWASQIGANIQQQLLCYAVIGEPVTVIYKQFTIRLLSVPTGPQWITPSGLLDSLVPQIEFGIQLEAVDPDLGPLTWSLLPGAPSWLNISNIGLLFGTSPNPLVSTTYSFSVQITDPSLVTNVQTFSLQVIVEQTNLTWITQSDLGISVDGAFSDKRIQAKTLQSQQIVTYGLSGGMLPPGTKVNHTSGMLEGYVDFHAQSKTYYFEISATDTVDTIVQQFRWTVQSQNLGIYSEFAIPITGEQRLQLITLNDTSVVDETQLFLLNEPGWGRLDRLAIPIISGIRHINSELTKSIISFWLHNFRVSLNYFSVTNFTNSDFQIVSLNVQDADSLHVWQPQQAIDLNQRVSSTQGLRYQSTTAGTTASLPPQGQSSMIIDGTVVWTYDSQPLPYAGVSWPLPWYPYHYYVPGISVVNDGGIYVCTQAGYSGGYQGPQGTQMNILDNQTEWDYVSNVTGAYGNVFFPANIFNLRKQLRDTFGLSTSWGTGAQFQVVVDSVSSGIQSITVINPGQGYWCAPPLRIMGMGQGAQLQAKLGLLQATVINSTVGFVLNDILLVDLGQDQSAQLKVTSVDNLGNALALQVVDAGLFDRVPSTELRFFKSQNIYVTAKLLVGIQQVQVLQPGRGYVYDQTFVDVSGYEIDSTAQRLINDFYFNLPLCYIQNSQQSHVREYLQTADNDFGGIAITANMISQTITGVQWQGHARFDTNDCTFDADQTRFVDFQPASQTIFDTNTTYWDDNNLTFDGDWLEQYPNWSQTIFDQATTIFDYYQTLFDEQPVQTGSRYARTSYWYFGKPFNP